MSKETIGLLLLTIGGATVTLYFLREAKRGWDSKRWPSTNGTVIASEIFSWSYDVNVTFWPAIKYEYIVESDKFSSGKLAFLSDFSYSSERGAEGILSRYKLGTQVKVFYHPKKPELSVLRPGFYISHLQIAIAGGGVTFLHHWSLRADRVITEGNITIESGFDAPFRYLLILISIRMNIRVNN